jgi:hypothetical protein
MYCYVRILAGDDTDSDFWEMKMRKQPTEQSFLKDVSEHRMTILRDDGIYRHVRFQKPNTGVMSFDLLTWPGWLCYSGDMGTYVFRRLEDMFEFFRTDRRNDGRALYINLGYWAEKIEAEDRHGRITEYSADKFRAQVNEWLNESEASDDLRQAVDEGVLLYADDGEQDALRAATDFEYGGKNVFQDFWEVGLREYTHHFVWCCYAIAWGINQYDADKMTKVSYEVGM